MKEAVESLVKYFESAYMFTPENMYDVRNRRLRVVTNPNNG